MNSDEDGKNPMVSPLLSENFSHLPPAHIVIAGYDILRDDGTQYFQKLRNAGVAATLKCYEHLIHGVFNMDGIVESVRPAIVEIAEMLKKGLS